MTERITQVKFAGLEEAPEGIQRRILAGQADQRVRDVRSAIMVAGAPVPERIREVDLLDAGKTEDGEHVVYAVIHRGRGALASVVSAAAPTPESARWILGADHNLPKLKRAYDAHRYVVTGRRRSNIDTLSADG
ncbi:MAG: hypothetical protein H0W89_00740 [Candidatus Levybacteria bacterium]|nr:hypothetical protein [Candidatus Levybacteria bacterium]